MSRASRLATSLARIQARIAEIETAYPNILTVASAGQGSSSFTNQQFAAVAKEYRELLAQEESISSELDAINGTEAGTSVATFQVPT